MRRATLGLWVVLIGVTAVPAARADPTQQEVFKSISDNVNGHEPISAKTIGGFAAVVVGLVILGVVVTKRQERDEVIHGGWGSAGRPSSVPAGAARGTPGVVNNPSKLMRELMKEAGLTRQQVRQLEALNDRLAADDRAVKHLATLLLCPSLIAAARPEQIVRAE